jgi:Tol biopolymer transport system component
MFTTDALAAALTGRYTIERLVGEGGMAKVYLARDLRHNRQVALKVLRPDLGAVVGVERFQAEIQVTANLQHPNLLPLFDSGAAGDLLFYVMPFVEGESLRQRLDREKQLPIDEAIRIATLIAGALEYAHRKGVIHRDLKPENILIQEGQPLVADFGIALAISNAGGARITQTGLSLGTPQYMSPEQATGDRVIDGRTDIYSLGALTYEMLTGEPPHVGATSQAVIARVLTEKPRSIRATRATVSEHVEATVERALEKLPADRFETAREFADALKDARLFARGTASASSAVATAPNSLVSRAREITAWTLVAGLSAVSAYFGVRATRTPPAPASAEFEIDVPDGIDVRSGGSAASLALSRDGRMLVFAGQRDGKRPMLYSRRIGDRFVQEIRGTEDGHSPIVSPDGKEVLFAVFKATAATIKRIDVAGGVAKTLVESGPRNGQISWRGGNQIVMAIDSGISIVNADNGSQRVIAKPDAKRGFTRYGFPDVLPGGKAALITIRRGDRIIDSTFIGVLSLLDGTVIDLGIRGLSPRYSVSGHLVYATAGQSLYAVPFDARRLRVNGSPTLLAEGVGGGNAGAVPLAISDNGTMAFIQSGGGKDEVTPAIVSRSGIRRLFGAAAGLYTNPRISPDGSQIAYSASGERGERSSLDRPDIWRMDVATGRSQRVTTNNNSDRPLWSRDGSEIFFSSNPKDTIEYAISLTAGAQPRAVFHGRGQLGTSDIGPAHTYAVFGIAGPTGPDLWVAPMDSLQRARPFAVEPYTEALPRISPDGRLVAYQGDRTGAGEVYVRSLIGGGEEVKVSSDHGTDPAWSRDGHELFYRSQPTDSKGQMMAVQIAKTPKLAVTGVRPLFSVDDYYTSGTRTVYDVFPNGDFLMFATRSDTGKARTPLVVRINWPSALSSK